MILPLARPYFSGQTVTTFEPESIFILEYVHLGNVPPSREEKNRKTLVGK
jgi:hypothetical protein